MMGLYFFIALEAEDRGQTTAPTAEQLIGWRPRLGSVLHPLAGPDDTPPARKVGYWSDGAYHSTVVTVSALGRRLFWEHEGEVLHTNVARYVYADID
jgi:hypothetical protein